MSTDFVPDNWVDVTPEDSFAPVYIVPLTEEDVASIEDVSLKQQEQEKLLAAQRATKESAIAKLAKLGLTAEEAAAIVGV